MTKSSLHTRDLTRDEIVRVVYSTIATDGRLRGMAMSATFDDLNKVERMFYTTMVEHLLTNPTSPHDKLHNEWRCSLINKGWVQGNKFCTKAKTHPQLKPYDELPYRTRLQHSLAHNITLAYIRTK